MNLPDPLLQARIPFQFLEFLARFVLGHSEILAVLPALKGQIDDPDDEHNQDDSPPYGENEAGDDRHALSGRQLHERDDLGKLRLKSQPNDPSRQREL